MVDSLKEYKFGFEKLDVWQFAVAFASQIRSAAVSISSNLAEELR
jgi:hypothetical protein